VISSATPAPSVVTWTLASPLVEPVTATLPVIDEIRLLVASPREHGQDEKDSVIHCFFYDSTLKAWTWADV